MNKATAAGISRSKAVRILKLRVVPKPRVRNGVSLWALALSVSRRTRIVHTISRVGRRWFCSCEASSFNPLVECKHRIAAKRLLAKRMEAAA